ncbi:Cullin-associated NEDD8-dissociated protein 1 [Orobanche hederae]
MYIMLLSSKSPGNRDVILAYEILPSIPKEHHNFKEVKDYAITCLGLVISTFGDHLRLELPSCLPVLVDCMGNERTRLTAVKAFVVIAASPLHLEISCDIEQVVSELSALLKKANQPLRQTTHGTLNTLIVGYGDKIGLAAYKVIIVELSSLISDSDLHMTALALELYCTLMLGERSRPSVGPTVRIMILPRAMTLVKSSLLQRQALQELQECFAVLVSSANTSFDELLETLVSTAKPSPKVGGPGEKALFSIATCIAVLCLAAGHEKCSSTVDMLANILKDDSNANVIFSQLDKKFQAKKHLSLLCLGEIGRKTNLSSHSQIENIIIESFQAPFEKIKSAASCALGIIAAGNLQKYMPFILKTLVMRGDLTKVNEILPSIPKEHHNITAIDWHELIQLAIVALFFESRGMIEDALEVATDPDYIFELAINLGKLEIAKDIATSAQSESKWKQLGELAMSSGLVFCRSLGSSSKLCILAEESLKQANDLSGLLLLYSSLGNAEGIAELALLAKEHGKNNVTFLCLFMLGKLEDCLQL